MSTAAGGLQGRPGPQRSYSLGAGRGQWGGQRCSKSFNLRATQNTDQGHRLVGEVRHFGPIREGCPGEEACELDSGRRADLDGLSRGQ